MLILYTTVTSVPQAWHSNLQSQGQLTEPQSALVMSQWSADQMTLQKYKELAAYLGVKPDCITPEQSPRLTRVIRLVLFFIQVSLV